MNNQINTKELINFLLHQQEEKTIDIDIAYKMFLNHITIHNRPGTLSAYKSVLKPILNYLKSVNVETTCQITTDVINNYILFRKNKIQPGTINKEIKNLQIMLRFAIKNNYIDKINFRFEPLKTIKKPIPKIEDESIRKILNYFETSNVYPKNKLMFLLILTTGIRTNELCHIKNSNIDLENGIIHLDFTKNGEPRNIYIVDSLKDLVAQVMNKTNYLFIDEHNERMTQNTVRQFFKHLKENCNIDILSPHKLRHYYATSIYNKSLDIYLVKDLLGHKSIQMTQIYLDINHKDNQLKNNIYSPLNDFATH